MYELMEWGFINACICIGIQIETSTKMYTPFLIGLN